jgi:hypothetical protein
VTAVVSSGSESSVSPAESPVLRHNPTVFPLLFFQFRVLAAAVCDSRLLLIIRQHERERFTAHATEKKENEEKKKKRKKRK